MKNTQKYAFRVHAGDSSYVVVEASMESAAAIAAVALPTKKLTGIELLGEALSSGRSRPAPSSERLGSGASPGGRATQVEQLVRLLEAERTLHVSEIASRLGTTVGNTHQVVRRAAAQGLVRRLGRRTGKVGLPRTKSARG